MELIQVNWDEERNLFLEFIKNDEDRLKIVPETVKSLNLKFEITKISRKDTVSYQMPSLISVKNIHYNQEAMCFCIDLEELSDPDELQIKIVELVIIYYSGKREEIVIGKKFNVSEIVINEDCYADYIEEDLNARRKIKNSITQERIYHKRKTDFNKNKEKDTYIYERKNIETDFDTNEILSIMRNGNERLKNIEEEVKNISSILKNMSFSSINYGPSNPVLPNKQVPGFERIKKPNKPSIKPPGKLPFLKELKDLIKSNTKDNSDFNFHDVLKPMNEEELKKITLNEEDLLKKEEAAIKNQVERLKKDEQEEISLESLKKPVL